MCSTCFSLHSTRKNQSELRSFGLKQSEVTEFVAFEIDCGVQLISFIVDPDHCFVQHDLIRIFVAGRLYIGLLYPVVNGGTTSFDTQLLKPLFGIRKGLAKQMKLNIRFNRFFGCPLSLHKLQIDPLDTLTEAVEFGHRPSEPTTASFLIRCREPNTECSGIRLLTGASGFS